MSNLSGFDDIMNSLNNVLNQVDNFDGKLTVYIENLVNNIDSFNSDFDTHFTKNTSIDDFQEYFRDEYISFMQEHLTDEFDYKTHFNETYSNYARIE